MFVSFSVSFMERRVSDEKVIEDEAKITPVLVDTRILAPLRMTE